LLRHEALPTEESKEPTRAGRQARAHDRFARLSAGDAKDYQGGRETAEAEELAAPISAEQLVFASSGALRIV
jgi:hypothetical protein